MVKCIDSYPTPLVESGALTPDVIDGIATRLAQTNMAQLQEELYGFGSKAGNIVVTPQGNRVVVAYPNDKVGGDSDAAVAVYTEWGFGIDPWTYLIAKVTRDAVNPGAPMVFLPNNTAGQNNLVLSRKEINEHTYSADPLVERGRRALELIGNPSKVLLLGSSLGTLPALAHGKERTDAGIVAIEPPHGKARSMARLAYEAGGNGKQRWQVVAANFASADDQLHRELIAGKRVAEKKWQRGILLDPANRAAIRILQKGNASLDIEEALDKERRNSVVVVYGDVDRVAPADVWDPIVEQFYDMAGFVGIKNKGADHSMAWDIPLVAGSMALAEILRKQ